MRDISAVIQYEISNLVPGITFTRYTHNQMIGKANNLKVLGARKSKDIKQDSKNRLRSHITEGEEP